MSVIWTSVRKEMLTFSSVCTEEKSYITIIRMSKLQVTNMQKSSYLSVTNGGGKFTQNVKTHNKLAHKK